MPRLSRRVTTRARISSRIGRTASRPWPAGSSSSQSSYRLPGKIGQASPQPMVTTTSEARTASVVSTLGTSAARSMPTSSMAATAAGLTESAGALPAERTSTAPPERWPSQPAAIWERPALCTQTKSTDGRSGACWDTVVPLPQGERDVDEGDEHRHLDERADHAGEGLAGSRPEGGDRDRDRQLEVVARSSERQRGGALVRHPQETAESEAAAPHQGEVREQR